MATVVEGSVGHGDPVPPSAIDLDIVQCLEACPMHCIVTIDFHVVVLPIQEVYVKKTDVS